MLTTAPIARRGRASVLARPWGTFTGRGLGPTESFDVADTAYLSATEAPVDTRTISTFDDARLALVESAQTQRQIALSDTVSLVLVESVSVAKPNIVDVPVTDTASLALTDEVGAMSAALDVTDTASITATEDAPTLETSATLLTANDTASLTLVESAAVTAEDASLAVAAGDEARLRLTIEAASVTRADAFRRIVGVRKYTTAWRREVRYE